MFAVVLVIRWMFCLLLLVMAHFGALAWGQTEEPDRSGFLVRMERQTRDEDVCILVRRDGQFHLERIALGVDRSRVFEGAFPSSVISELEQMLDADELQQLSQSNIKMALVGEELDHVLLAIRRSNGWQSLNFPTGASRKPFRKSLEPLVKWLERNEQQPHPLPNAVPARCMPPQETPQTTTASASGANDVQRSPQAGSSASPGSSYLMRIVKDHYLPNDLTFGSRVERTCVIVYQTGQYRMEKSKQEFNSAMKTEVFRDSVSDTTLRQLRQILDGPELSQLHQKTAAAGMTIREGEVTNLAIPRSNDTQVLSFASFFGAHLQEKGMRDNTHLSVDDSQAIKPLNKWIKANIEERKLQAQDLPATTCIPSTQP